MKPRTRSFVYGLGACAALVFIGLLGARVYLATAYFRNTVLAKINPVIAGHIRVEDHRLALLRGKIVLIEGALEGPSGETLAAFERLTVNVNWISLLRRRIGLDAIVLKRPRVVLEKTPSGGFTLQQALRAVDKQRGGTGTSEARPASPVMLTIGSFEIDAGQLVYGDPTLSLRTRVSAIKGTGALDLIARTGRINLETGRIRWVSQAVDEQIDGLRLTASFKGSQLKVAALQTAYHRSHIQVAGKVDGVFTQPVMEVELQADVDMADLKSIAAARPDMHGRLTVKINVNGSPNNPQADLNLKYDGGRLGAYQVAGASLQAALKDRQFTIVDFGLDVASGHVSGTGTIDARRALPGGVLPFQFQPDRLTYDVKLQGSHVEMAHIVSGPRGMTGVLDGNFHLSGQGLHPHRLSAAIAAEITAPHVGGRFLATPVDFELKGAAHVDQGFLKVDHLTMTSQALAASLDLNGTVDLVDRKLEAAFSFKAPSVSGPLTLAGINGIQGAVDLNGEVTGDLDRPRFNLNLAGDHLAYNGFTVGSVACIAQLGQDGRLDVSQFELRSRAGNIRGQGNIKLLSEAWQLDAAMPTAIDLTVAALRPETIYLQSPVKGQLDGHIRLAGSVKQPQAEVSLKGRDITTAQGPVGDAQLEVELKNGVATVSRLDIVRGASRLGLQGWARLFDGDALRMPADPAFEIDLSARRIEISEYTKRAEGAVSVQAHLQGTLADPSGTVALQADHAVIAGQPLDRIEMAANIANRTIFVSPLQILSQAGEKMTAQGRVGFDRTFEGTAESDGWPLARVGLLQDIGEVEGQLSFALKGTGSLDAPAVDGNVHIGRLALSGQPFKDVNFVVALRDQKARVLATQAFDLEATYAFDSGDFDLVAVFDQTQLKPYFALAGQAALAGTVTGSLQAHGNSNRLAETDGELELGLLELRYDTEHLVSTQNLKAELRGKHFVLHENTVNIMEQGRLTFQGRGALDGSIAMVIDGAIPLKAAGPFLSADYDLGGRIVLKASLNGTAANPRVDARIRLDDVNSTLPMVSQRLHGLNGDIQITESKAVFDDIHGKLDKGRFFVAGSLDLQNWLPERLDLTVGADQLPFEVPDTMRLLLSSRLALKGDRHKASIEGELVLLEGTYFKHIAINPLKGITTVRRETPKRTVRPAMPFLGHATLDVAVQRRQPFVVDNNLAYLEISPDLRLTGTVDHPLLNGRAQVDTGEVFYAGKTFVVKRGVVDFLNPYTIEPTLDIHSDVMVSDWLITLLITGTPDNLKVELSSDPPETKADILSLLVTGKTSAQMRGGSSGQGMSASQMMAQLAASTFGEDIKNATGIDYLEVETADSQGDGESGLIKVTIGKKLTERMTLKYAVSSKQGETVRTTISEYQLLDRFLVSGFQDTKGIYGGELVFRIEFR